MTNQDLLGFGQQDRYHDAITATFVLNAFVSTAYEGNLKHFVLTTERQ